MRKVKTASGGTAVQIVEKRNGRRRILEHVGSAHDETELAVLLSAAQQRVHGVQDEMLLVEQPRREPVGPIVEHASSEVLWRVLTDAYARLGFDQIDDEVFASLVAARIIEPTSMVDSLRVLDDLGLEHASRRTMVRTLTRVGAGKYRDQIAAACFAHAATAGDISLCLYDVTTLYFEAAKEDELRKVGYSKERRVDPQVVVGLLVDRRGFPLEIGCFEGYKAETATLIPIIEGFQARHGLTDFVVVADAGMLSAANLKSLDEAGLRFIVGSRVTKAPGDLASHFRWHGDAFTDAQIIDTITLRRTKPDPARLDTCDEPVWNPQAHPLAGRAEWQYSRKRADRDQHTLTAQQNRAQATIDGHHPPLKAR